MPKDNIKRKHLVAVYGTLRKGLYNHRLIQDAPQVLVMQIQGFKMRSLGAFPIVEYAPQDSMITAEVYHLTDHELEMCDRLEGHPTWYERTKIGALNMGDGAEDLQMYVMPNGKYPNDEIVESGDWVKFTEGK